MTDQTGPGQVSTPADRTDAEARRGILTVREYTHRTLLERQPLQANFVARLERGPLSYHPAWLGVLERGLGHTVYALEATEAGQIRGYLGLAFLKSRLFGRFLVSLPYLNYGSVLADDDRVAYLLIDHAVRLADRLDVRYLELRHERAFEHPALVRRDIDKAHMRLALPSTSSALWDQLTPKVRNQVRKGQKSGLTIDWGRLDLLPGFYAVFSHNMRDLGTPVYGRTLFRSVIEQFPDQAEFCVVRDGPRPVAGALLLHGRGTTEVPSASSLRSHNPSCANMLMYWALLERAIGRGQTGFDFGRSTPGSNTARFKSQWGAVPGPAEWQYYQRIGSASEMRTDSPKYQRMIRLWQRLPVRLTRWIGPVIVRGIP